MGRYRSLSRRTFLRAAGVGLALPLLDAMMPAMALGETAKVARNLAGGAPRRMVAIETNMGILPHYFYPEGSGQDYKPSPYLDILKDHRKNLTVFSGVSHPEVDGGHQAETAFLTATPHPGRGGFKNTVSLDQYAAEQIGVLTRFPSVTLLVSSESHQSLSFTRSGVMIPGEKSPAKLFEQMFLQGSPKEIEAQAEQIRVGRSILDTVADRAKGLQKDLGKRDGERLDQYFTSVRELEKRLVTAEEWEYRPKPKVNAIKPTDITDMNELVGRTRLMFDLVRMALETDSTRLVTLFINTASIVPHIEGVKSETHSLTHHGNKTEKLDELRRVEEAQFKVLGELLTGLSGVKEQGDTLLDRTMVLYGTCMGNANAHSNDNLPVLLAGGGFKHAGHLAFDKKKNYPLPNLFVSMLQRMGIESDRFASSTGTMRGLDLA